MNYSPYISVTPRIVRAWQETRLHISPRFDFIRPQGNFFISVVPRHRFYSVDRVSPVPLHEITFADGSIHFSFRFSEEQEYVVLITDQNKNQILRTSVYALEEDLYDCYAVKGDLHLHTTYSDGVESPEHRIAIARQKGMDCLAITDHNNYSGSERAVSLLKRFSNNMICIHGEEVQAPHCPAHILSLGANQSITEQIQNDPCYETRLADLSDKEKANLPDDVNPLSYVSAQDVFQRIRQANGLSVLCHIYWEVFNTSAEARLGTPEPLVEALAEHCQFDAFEVTSGAPLRDIKANFLQDAFWREKLPRNFPVIGITDSHTTLRELGSIFGRNFTIIFTKQFSESGILDSIRNGMSVSVDGVTGTPLCHGSLRLSKYAAFLLEEYFPLHDKTVRVEGDLMERCLLFPESTWEVLPMIMQSSHLVLSQEWGTIYPKKQ